MDNTARELNELIKNLLPMDKISDALSKAEYIRANNIKFNTDTNIRFAVDKNNGKVTAFCIPDEYGNSAVYFYEDDVKMHRDAPAHIVCQDMFLFCCQFDSFYQSLLSSYEAAMKTSNPILQADEPADNCDIAANTAEFLLSDRASDLIRRLHEKEAEKTLQDAAIAHAEMLNKIAPYNEKINDLIFIGRAMQAVGAPVIWADINHIGFTDFDGGTEEDALGEIAKLGIFMEVPSGDERTRTVKCVTIQAGDVNYSIGNKDALPMVEKMLSQLTDFENAVYKMADEWLAKR